MMVSEAAFVHLAESALISVSYKYLIFQTLNTRNTWMCFLVLFHMCFMYACHSARMHFVGFIVVERDEVATEITILANLDYMLQLAPFAYPRHSGPQEAIPMLPL